MPVVTRSCGKGAPRRRIEDPTPVKPCRTTAKRRKDISDEENERPPKKKSSISSKQEATFKTLCDKRNERRSRIPRRCVSEKLPAKSKIISNCMIIQDNNEVSFKTPSVSQSPKATDEQYIMEETPVRSPVASRTRAYSALKRSLKKKKQSQGANKTTMMETTSGILKNGGRNQLQENEKQDEEPFQVKEADSSTHDDDDDDSGHLHFCSNEEDGHDQYYKNKFQGMVQHLKQMQEQFSQTHQNTAKNLKAYDVFVKQLKTSLEEEKNKNAVIEEELSQTRNQLLMAQREIEVMKTNQHQHKKGVDTSCATRESPQNKKSSQLDKLEKSETSTLHAMIKFYSGITGITLSSDSQSSCSEIIERYHCTYRPKGSNGPVMQFYLTHDKEFEEYEYSPNFPSPKRGEFLYKISAHLKENMYFNSDQVQLFLASLIKAV